MKTVDDIVSGFAKFCVVEVGEKYYGDTFTGESHNNLLTREETVEAIQSLLNEQLDEIEKRIFEMKGEDRQDTGFRKGKAWVCEEVLIKIEELKNE